MLAQTHCCHHSCPVFQCIFVGSAPFVSPMFVCMFLFRAFFFLRALGTFTYFCELCTISHLSSLRVCYLLCVYLIIGWLVGWLAASYAMTHCTVLVYSTLSRYTIHSCYSISLPIHNTTLSDLARDRSSRLLSLNHSHDSHFLSSTCTSQRMASHGHTVTRQIRLLSYA